MVCLISGINVPAQGAKLPSIPMLMEFGIKPLAKVCASRVSSNNASVSLAATSNSVGLKACVPLCNRSEEHTSELQSRENLVCRLLLVKKKLYSTHLCL